MNIVGYIVLGIVILIVAIIYITFLWLYIGYARVNREATKTQAVIIEDLGKMKFSTGHHAIGVPRFRIFHRYMVSYWVNGQELIEETELKSHKYKVGERVEVRYDISKKGKVSLMSEAMLCWLQEMAVGYTLGLILGIVLSVLKANGYIE